MSKETLKEKDILCLGHLKRVFPLIDALKDVGCERDKAGNRELFFSDYVKLVLLYTWNPLIGSVHDLQEAAALPRVAKTLGIKRFSAGSFSESPRVYEPERLQPIIQELTAGLPTQPIDRRLSEFKHALTLVDGTVVRGLNRLVHSAVGIDGRYNTTRDGARSTDGGCTCSWICKHSCHTSSSGPGRAMPGRNVKAMFCATISRPDAATCAMAA